VKRSSTATATARLRDRHEPAAPARLAMLLATAALGLLCSLRSGVASAASAAAASAPVAGAVAATGATANGRCLGCHDNASFADAAGHSLAVLSASFQSSAHRGLACTDCHTDALTVRHPRQPLAPVPLSVCAGCHQGQIRTLASSIHGTRGMSPALCTSCHGDVHSVPPPQNPNNSMSPVNQVRSCGQCHQNMMDAYLKSVHAHALLVAGLSSAPACTDCHGSGHGIQPVHNAAAPTSFGHVPQTCGTCHTGILRLWLTGTHGRLWQQGDTNGPVCSTCHEAHAIIVPTSAQMRQLFPSECGDCHAKLYQSYHDSFHGQATALGWVAVAKCSDCHTPHQNLPRTDARSSVNPARLTATCGKCHDGAVNAAFVTFDPHADPRDPHRNLYVHWAWLLMTGLLLAVFGFFAVHDFLWLQRTVVGKLRGEYPTRPAHGPYVRRFTTAQSIVHVTVIVSFLLLAATGLPLRFVGAPWAPWLTAAFGGIPSADILHRIAAVITFGYFGYHVLGVLYRMLIKHEHGFLWGPRSMVPQPRDVRDLIANVAYFLYLRPRPAFDRWTYWEKFDYLAVFWGVAIIGFSGLMLWFPGAFTRVLPGWTLNVAFITHSDEALLATGFIFVFHFFHTHLRPEIFPMDPAVFTGRLPLERFEHERPLQYQRLLESHQLEQMLAPAPTKAELARAYVFGFLAVAVGVALAIGILVGLLQGYGR
jgi:thiosulfate reductase cytochrome b subunit